MMIRIRFMDKCVPLTEDREGQIYVQYFEEDYLFNADDTSNGDGDLRKLFKFIV